MKNDSNFEISKAKVKQELAGYSVRLELIKNNNIEAKRFDEIDHQILFDHTTQSFPGIPISISSSMDESIEILDDEF